MDQLKYPRFGAGEGALMAAEDSPAERVRDTSRSGVSGAASEREDVDVLMSSAASGDHNAWTRLVDRLGPTVWAATRTATNDPVVSAEAAQTTWLRFADRLGQKANQAGFEAWLIETARREVHRSLMLRGMTPTAG